jgi:hypothetical protein
MAWVSSRSISRFSAINLSACFSARRATDCSQPLGEVRDPQDELVCVTVYKRGVVEVVRRLAA